jgi:hypothetical protein
MVNPILMQPRNSLQYADKMNLVADELVDNIKFLAEQNNGQMPKTFTNELHKWSLESIGVVTLDEHLGSDVTVYESNSLDFFIRRMSKKEFGQGFRNTKINRLCVAVVSINLQNRHTTLDE